MNIFLALFTAKIAFIATFLAAGYYFLRMVYVEYGNIAMVAPIKQPLMQLVVLARRTHPYLGMAAFLMLPYHAYIMLTYFRISIPAVLGILSMVTMTVMLLSGALLGHNRNSSSIRQSHRIFMYAVLLTSTMHVILAG